MREAVVVMAKAPVPGQVKTRMVPPLTPGGAAAFATALLQDTLANAAATGAEVVVSVAGDARVVRSLVGGGVRITPQRGRTFAARLRAAQADAVEAGADRVVLLAADAPTVGPDLLRAALDALDRAEVAICPARDGGYVLLATDRATPDLFTGIRMGTDRVYEQTLARIARGARPVEVLPTRHDVDRLADVRAAAAAGELAWAPRTAAAALAAGLLEPRVVA